MGQITTTNRMAILDLIAQADETVEVSSLSQSVTQLQVDVMSLSASVAGLTGSGSGTSGTSGINGSSGTSGINGSSGTSGINGSSGTSGINGANGTSGTSGANGTSGTSGANGTSGTSVNGLNEFLLLDVPSGVATFSASASITSTVTDGTDTSTLTISPASLYLENTNGTNTAYHEVSYLQSYMSNTYGTIGSDLSLSSGGGGGIVLTSYDGTNTSTENITPTDITSTSTDGTYTTTNYIAADNTYNEIVGEGNTSSTSVSATQIVSSITDGSITTTQTMTNQQLEITSVEGSFSGGAVFKWNYNNIQSVSTADGTASKILQYADYNLIESRDGDGINISSVTTNKASIDLASTDGINSLIFTMDSSTGVNTISSTDGTNTSTENITPTDITSITTDGNITDTISLDPQGLVNGTGIFSEDGSGSGPAGAITSHIKIQSQTPNLMSSNGTDVGTIDVGPGYVNMSGNDGSTPITDTISIDPKALGDGTGIKSVGGAFGNTSQTIYTPDTIISTTTDTTNTITDTISLDPQGLVNGTQIKSENATTNEASTIGISYNNVTISSTDGTNTSTIELDPNNNNNGNRFYSTDGSSTNDLTLSPDYMNWDCNYVTGDTRVGLEFDPSGLLGVTRFYKENYVTNEVSSLGLDTTNISLSSSDASDTTSVGLDLTSIFLSVDTPSNNRLQEISLDTDIVISSSSGGTTSNITIMEDIVTIISTDGVEQGELRVEPKGITFKFIPAFDDDADAASGGLTADMLYQTTGLGASPLDVAGILMIKQ